MDNMQNNFNQNESKDNIINDYNLSKDTDIFTKNIKSEKSNLNPNYIYTSGNDMLKVDLNKAKSKTISNEKGRNSIRKNKSETLMTNDFFESITNEHKSNKTKFKNLFGSDLNPKNLSYQTLNKNIEKNYNGNTFSNINESSFVKSMCTNNESNKKYKIIDKDSSSKSIASYTPNRSFNIIPNEKVRTPKNRLLQNTNDNPFDFFKSKEDDDNSNFFKKCRIILTHEKYLELMNNVKLFNNRCISKEDAYNNICNIIQSGNYYDLLHDFQSFFK